MGFGPRGIAGFVDWGLGIPCVVLFCRMVLGSIGRKEESECGGKRGLGSRKGSVDTLSFGIS